MSKNSVFSFKIVGRRALFSDPVSRVGGEKMSYHLPTYQALKGITESIYWKPSIIWKIRRVRILNPIRTESVGVKPIKYSGKGNELSFYTYLRDVAYQVEVEMTWNTNRPELKNDWNRKKHEEIFKRSLARGGRRDIFLGTRECQAYVEPCEFGDGDGSYDESGELAYGVQFHSFIYPDENTSIEGDRGNFQAKLWHPVMYDGVVRFLDPDDCSIQKQIYTDKIKRYIPGENFSFSEGCGE